jgi:hypothetical protein
MEQPVSGTRVCTRQAARRAHPGVDDGVVGKRTSRVRGEVGVSPVSASDGRANGNGSGFAGSSQSRSQQNEP